MPSGVCPTVTVLMVRGGLASRSITDSLLSGTVLLGSLGSIFVAAVTSASFSSGVMATLSGGPTTLVGTAISASTLGALPPSSITVTVSAAGFFTTVAA